MSPEKCLRPEKRRDGIFILMNAKHAHGQITVGTKRKILSAVAVSLLFYLQRVDQPEICNSFLPDLRLKHRHDFCLLALKHKRGAFFDDARLFRSNLSKRISKHRHVVIADLCDHGYIRHTYGIGCVQPPAKSGL